MKASEIREGLFVRIRPTACSAPAVGIIFISDELPLIKWFWRSRESGLCEFERLDACDLLPLPDGEGQLIMELARQLEPSNHPWHFCMAFEVAVVGWLDLRRDGINVQPPDLIDGIAKCHLKIRATSIKRGRKSHGATH
jgi:hypothetical protein